MLWGFYLVVFNEFAKKILINLWFTDGIDIHPIYQFNRFHHCNENWNGAVDSVRIAGRRNFCSVVDYRFILTSNSGLFPLLNASREAFTIRTASVYWELLGWFVFSLFFRSWFFANTPFLVQRFYYWCTLKQTSPFISRLALTWISEVLIQIPAVPPSLHWFSPHFSPLILLVFWSLFLSQSLNQSC